MARATANRRTRRTLLAQATVLGGGMLAAGAACGSFRERAQSPAAERTVQLTYLHQWSQQQGHGPATNQAVARFQEQTPTIRVESVFTSNYYEKITAILAAGDLPDVITYNLAFLPQLVRRQVAISPETLAKGSHRIDKPDMVPAAREMATFDGRLMAMPYVLNNTGMAYNQTLFRQQGLAAGRPPATWNEWVELGRRLTGGSGDSELWGCLFPRGTADPISPLLCLLWQHGGEVVEMNRRIATWNSQAGVDGLQFMVDLIQRHRIAPLQAPGSPERQGKIGLWLIPPGNVSVLQMAIRDQFEWATAAIPRAKLHVSSMGGHSLVVLKTNRHHEQAWRFIHWFTQPEHVAAYDAATTTLPPWRSAERQPAWQRHVREQPRIKPFVEMLAYGRPTPQLSTWQDITDVLVEAREAAAAQKLTPKQALDEAARIAEPLIKDG